MHFFCYKSQHTLEETCYNQGISVLLYGTDLGPFQRPASPAEVVSTPFQTLSLPGRDWPLAPKSHPGITWEHVPQPMPKLPVKVLLADGATPGLLPSPWPVRGDWQNL